MTKKYPSDLTYKQFKLIEPLIPEAKTGGRPRTTNIRQILNGIIYKVKTDCPWGYLPKEYPPYKTVFDYFRKWSLDGTWEIIHNEIVKLVRKKRGVKKLPACAL
jgi:putative transposase